MLGSQPFPYQVLQGWAVEPRSMGYFAHLVETIVYLLCSGLSVLHRL